jgi:hypothetical protein
MLWGELRLTLVNSGGEVGIAIVFMECMRKRFLFLNRCKSCVSMPFNLIGPISIVIIISLPLCSIYFIQPFNIRVFLTFKG